MIEIEHLDKFYGAFKALDDVHLVVEPGEIFGFLGPNGAGKTTTIRIVAGLLKPSSGTVRIGGFDVQKAPEEAKALLGVIPDRPFLYEKLTAVEFLRFLGKIHGLERSVAETRIGEFMELFDLEEWKEELIENYSHGMQQRLVMSSAFLHSPKALVVDEPMVGLDPRGARLVKEVFRREARQRGMSIFMSTHTLEVAQQMCDRIAILQQGRVIALGTPEELQILAGSEDRDLESIFLRLTGGEDVRAILQALRSAAP